MTTAITWTLVAAYVGSGLAYARSTLRRWDANPDKTFGDPDSFDKGMLAAASLLVGLLWPVAIAFHALTDWLWKPVDRDHARVRQMRADRDRWREQSRTGATEAERETARLIVETLDDLIAQKGHR